MSTGLRFHRNRASVRLYLFARSPNFALGLFLGRLTKMMRLPSIIIDTDPTARYEIDESTTVTVMNTLRLTLELKAVNATYRCPNVAFQAATIFMQVE